VRSGADRDFELSQVFSVENRLLPSREVSALRKDRIALHVIKAGGEFTWRASDTFRPHRHRCGRANDVTSLNFLSQVAGLIVIPDRGADGVGNSIDHQFVDQDPRWENREDVTIAIGSVTKLLHDPARQAGRRVGQGKRQGLRLGALNDWYPPSSRSQIAPRAS